jgi:hypothetical protein
MAFAIEILGPNGLLGDREVALDLHPRRRPHVVAMVFSLHRPLCDLGMRLLADYLDARTDHRYRRAARWSAPSGATATLAFSRSDRLGETAPDADFANKDSLTAYIGPQSALC